MLVDQAEVIVTAVQALPTDLDPQVAAEAQATLVGYAADYDARDLRILGRRILQVVAPEVGEAHEAKILEREEREAAAAAMVPALPRRPRQGPWQVHRLLATRGDARQDPAGHLGTETPDLGGRAGARTRPPLRTPAGSGV